MSREKNEAVVDAFLKQGADYATEQRQARYTELRGRRKSELDMWEHWNTNGRKTEHLDPLLKSLDPMIDREAKKRLKGLGGSIPFPALKGMLQNTVIPALESYDPTKSQLSTHITTSFQRVTDFVSKNRNARYMPRKILDKYQQMQNAKNEFENEHGRPPEFQELQGMLPRLKDRGTKDPWKTLKTLHYGTGAEAYSDMGTGDLEHDPGSQPDAFRSAFLTMKPVMNQAQQRFGDMHYPAGGKRQMSVAQIAAAMDLPEHKVRYIKQQVEKKLAPALKGR